MLFCFSASLLSYCLASLLSAVCCLLSAVCCLLLCCLPSVVCFLTLTVVSAHPTRSTHGMTDGGLHDDVIIQSFGRFQLFALASAVAIP